MGKYSNVNVTTLETTINNVESLIKKYDISEIRRNLINNKVIQESKVEAKVSEALTKIATSEEYIGSIKTLNNLIKKLDNARNQIKLYQNLEKQIPPLEKKLYKTKYTYETKIVNGKSVRTKVANTVIDQNVQNRINSLRNSMSKYEANADKYLTE